jgi:hypothetical protein
MTDFYSADVLDRTRLLIEKRFHVDSDRALQLAELALDGMVAHGLDPAHHDSVKKTVEVVVRSWIYGK